MIGGVLLTVTTTRTPARDLGYLLGKHPDRTQSFETAAGQAYVCFPEATDERCTAALLLEIDPVGLTRGRGKQKAPADFALGQYVNDRPYAASSLFAVAMARVFRDGMKGHCPPKPELAAEALPLELTVPALPCRGGVEWVHRVFAPLGWEVTADPVPLDPAEWGDSRYVTLTLRGTMRLADALNHLYVLLPVLDGAKHYWVAPDEVDKLIRAGDGWLADHPERDAIARRYLARRYGLTRAALTRLAEADDLSPDDAERAADATNEEADLPEAATQQPEEAAPADPSTTPAEEPTRVSLARVRRDAVLAALADSGAARVLDLGCGGGALLAELLKDKRYTEIVGADVGSRALELAERRLRLDRLPERQRGRISLLQTGLTYGDDRLAGYDAAVLMEVVEHVDPARLPALERAVFQVARPGTVIVTTPNVEYNVRYETLATGTLRHHDHRFEWTRAEFRAWVDGVAGRTGYTVAIHGVGDDDPEVGTPTQMAVFAVARPATEAADESTVDKAVTVAASPQTDGPEEVVA